MQKNRKNVSESSYITHALHMTSNLLALLVFTLSITCIKSETASAYSLNPQTGNCNGCCPQGWEEYWMDGYTGDCTQCRRCPANHTSGDCPSHDACYPVGQSLAPLPDCGPGYTGPAGNCTPCIASTYKPSTGADCCTDCPLNSRHALEAQAHVSACVCDPGYMMFDHGICTSVGKQDTVSVDTRNTNGGSSKYYTDKATVAWIMFTTVIVLLE